MKTLAILGSSRSDGNTAAVLRRLITGTDCELVDLNQVFLSHFRYDQSYGDDFIPLVRRILGAETVIIATPVYWYSYSSIMKVFIDRFSDLLMSEKSLGRQLRGKRFGLVSTGSDAKPDETLVSAYTRFCDYLGIENMGCLYSQNDGPFTDLASETRFRAILKTHS